MPGDTAWESTMTSKRGIRAGTVQWYVCDCMKFINGYPTGSDHLFDREPTQGLQYSVQVSSRPGEAFLTMSQRFFVLGVLLQIFTCVWTEACGENGAVRLVDGAINVTEGRLEICVNGVWGTVCNDGMTDRDGFDIDAARVVCRQLGLPEDVVITDISFGGGGLFQPVHLDDVQCTGTEPNLLNCSHNVVGVNDCNGHKEDVGIICERSQDCTDGDVRLVDGDNYNATEGRVEYCVGGQWGTVCNYLWTSADAVVVCQQLGLSTPEPRALTQNVPQVKNYQTPIVLDGLNCRGNEANLGQCEHEPIVEGCSHSDDAGAFCTNIRECNDGDVRLVQSEGDTENKGRVEYCNSGRWGMVCSDDNWDNNDATVICRQLGYNVENGSAAATDKHPGRDPPPLLLNRVDCIGTEDNITQCPRDDTHGCLNTAGGVICPNVSECSNGEVRLQDGGLSNEIGRVEVCMAGQWGLVCHNHWDDIDASVVCGQLGYTGGVATKESTFGRTSEGHFVLNDVNCTGNESSIFDCQYPKNLSPDACKVVRDEEAGVICGVSPGISERCTQDHTNNTLPLEESATNVMAGSIGTCQPYLHQTNLCNAYYNSSDYIFTAINQSQNIVSNELNGRIFPVLSRDDEECGDLISRVLCHYFFAPCGTNGLLHLPLAICPDECNYVQSACSRQWGIANNQLSNAGLSTVSCSATGALLKGLAPCCTGAGIKIKAIAKSGVATSVPVELVIGLLSALIAMLIVVVVVVIFVAMIVSKKRKATIRSLQMEVLSSPTVTSMESKSMSFRKSHDETEFGVEVKLRNNGSRRLQQAVPNPYSNKQDLALSPPLLTPGENKMMNRISSSIIRELSSNMLIPYTRLKLLECVGQGEFGVVYKAQYTEPEGDIGYKTSTVAVKTLKGFFDNSQVNKIMEESIKMKHFDHPNVLHLIGVCLDAGPAPYVVMPYMANGSLLHYLKKERNNLVLPVEVDDDVKIDVRKRLTVICLQIASGMDYLAGEKFVHRDLAARNCMIDIHFVIKIADFGLSEDVYAKNYFRQSGSDKSIKLPVKWMAPESLSDGVFSEKSDVWSYGVTCWEIFSGGKTPYPGVDPLLLSQMLDTEQRLNKPLNAACPDEIYSLMMSCWAKVPDERPSFSNIVSTISSYTEIIAGYLDISSYNPFESTYASIGDATTAIDTAATNSLDNDGDVIASSASTEPLVQKVGNGSNNSEDKNSKAMSKASPSASPRVPPLLRLSQLKEDEASTTSSAGIEIRVQSPSENGSVL